MEFCNFSAKQGMAKSTIPLPKIGNFRYVTMLTASTKSITGTGMYIIFSTIDASPEGKINTGIVMDLIYIQGNRYAYTTLGTNALKDLLQSVSDSTITFNITQSWQQFAVYQVRN